MSSRTTEIAATDYNSDADNDSIHSISDTDNIDNYGNIGSNDDSNRNSDLDYCDVEIGSIGDSDSDCNSHSDSELNSESDFESYDDHESFEQRNNKINKQTSHSSNSEEDIAQCSSSPKKRSKLNVTMPNRNLPHTKHKFDIISRNEEIVSEQDYDQSEDEHEWITASYASDIVTDPNEEDDTGIV